VRPIPDSDLLSLWETSIAAPSVERAMRLLSLAYPEIASPEQLSIGERDARLLALREQTFGSSIECATACPKCAENLDVEFTVQGLLKNREGMSADVLQVSREGTSLTMRLPNSLDLLKLLRGDTAPATGKGLFTQCVLEATRDQVPVAPEDVPDSIIDAAGEILSEADPLADMQIRLACPSCDHSWDISFDIAAYFWNEIDTWARRALRTVHLLAGEYGWTESEILKLSPARRRHYVDLITAEHGVDLE
jgi:hypothetical protein